MNNLVTIDQNIQDTMPGFSLVKALYPTMPKLYEKEFDIRYTQRHTEYGFGKRMMSEAVKVLDGGQAPYATFSNYGQKQFNFPIYSLQVNITRQYLQDNLYRAIAPQLGVAFLQSMIEAVNLEVAKFYADGFRPGGNPGLDGVTLYSTQHNTAKGPVSNTLNGNAMLNISTFYQLLVKMWRFKANNGFFVANNKAKVVTVPPEMTAVMYVMLESQFSPNTSSFAVNPASGMRWVSDGIHVNPYIAKNQVMIRTNLPGMYMYIRWPFDIQQMPNISTFTLLTSCFMRFLLDYDDFRASLGLQQPLSADNYL
jgi:hypothetical protein